MNVSPISYNPHIAMCSNQSGKSSKCIASPIYTPAGIVTVAGVGAFGIGLGIDRLCSYMFGMSRNIKTSLIVNGLVASVIGLYTYTQAKSAEKELQNS